MPKDKKGHYFLKPDLNHSTLLFQVKIYRLKSLTKCGCIKTRAFPAVMNVYTLVQRLQREQKIITKYLIKVGTEDLHFFSLKPKSSHFPSVKLNGLTCTGAWVYTALPPLPSPLPHHSPEERQEPFSDRPLARIQSHNVQNKSVKPQHSKALLNKRGDRSTSWDPKSLT